MQPIREFFVQTFGIEAWLAMLLAIVVIALLVSQAARLLFNQLDRWTHQSQNAWDEALVEAARRPTHLLIWIVALAWIARVVLVQWPDLDFGE